MDELSNCATNKLGEMEYIIKYSACGYAQLERNHCIWLRCNHHHWQTARTNITWWDHCHLGNALQELLHWNWQQQKTTALKWIMCAKCGYLRIAEPLRAALLLFSPLLYWYVLVHSVCVLFDLSGLNHSELQVVTTSNQTRFSEKLK